MAKNDDLPEFRLKRKILFGPKVAPEKLRELGERFMKAERYDDALEFTDRAGADDLTRQVAEEAMLRGDTPLYMRAKKVLGEQITESEWDRLARGAEKGGHYSSALLAYSQAGRTEEADRVRRLMPRPEGEEADTDALPAGDAPPAQLEAPADGEE